MFLKLYQLTVISVIQLYTNCMFTGKIKFVFI